MICWHVRPAEFLCLRAFSAVFAQTENGGLRQALLVHRSGVELEHGKGPVASNRADLVESAPGLGKVGRGELAQAMNVPLRWEAVDLSQCRLELLREVATHPWPAELVEQDGRLAYPSDGILPP